MPLLGDWNCDVAPLAGVLPEHEPWLGRLPVKPWEFPITAAIVHRDTPAALAGVVQTLRAQTVRPYILVIDTGSGFAARRELDCLEAASFDLEVHHIRSRAWRCTSQPVTAAMDLAFSLCQSEYLYATHTDVFLRRPDYLEFLSRHCSARCPAVGWQMSPRPLWPTDAWQRTLSHTASLYHMPTMRRLGVTWNLLAAFDAVGVPHGNPHGTGYPDTETQPALVLEAAGFPVRWIDEPDDGGNHQIMIGPEPNEPYENLWLSHVRSAGSAELYQQGTLGHLLRRLQCEREVAALPRRLADWQTGRYVVPLDNNRIPSSTQWVIP